MQDWLLSFPDQQLIGAALPRSCAPAASPCLVVARPLVWSSGSLRKVSYCACGASSTPTFVLQLI